MSTVARILARSAEGLRRVTVRAFAFEPRTPPVAIQLWNTGDNATDHGVHRWTARSVVEVLQRYETRGNPLLVDVEHNGAKTGDEGEPTITGGYARLEMRAGEPWLVFDWSAYTVEQISTGQRRFLSPEYDVDRITGEIVALYRVSLVAEPGTHRARVLAAARQENEMDPKLAAIMAILSSVADPAAAIDAIKSLVANLDGGDAGGEPPAEAQAGPPGEEGGQQMAADDKTGDDGKDKDQVAAVAASAPAKPPTPATPAPAAAPVAAVAAPPASAPDTTKIAAAATAAVTQIENAQRDHLILTEGHRLDPSIRKWASAQPFAVVRGLIAAAPAVQETTDRVAATRGATQGLPAKAKGLEGEQLETLEKRMGTFKASALAPHETEKGVLVLPSVAPSIYRERKRAAATTALSAGKAGK